MTENRNILELNDLRKVLKWKKSGFFGLFTEFLNLSKKSFSIIFRGREKRYYNGEKLTS